MKHETPPIGSADAQNVRRKRGQIGLVRAARYHSIRILRIRATPHSIAVGVSAGVVAAFLPVIGVHIALAIALAWLLGGNMIAAGASTVLAGNPLTYPVIWAATWEAGQLILGNGVRGTTRFNLHELFHKMDFASIWRPILKPMLVGFIPLSLVCGAISYILVSQAIRIYRARRQARLSAR